MRHYWIVIFCVAVMTVGQLLFKQVAINYNKSQSLLAANVMGTLAVAGFLYVVSTGLWIWALRHVALSRAYPVFALGFALVPLMGIWLFNEPVNSRFLLGVVLIVVGVILTGSS